jgi:hypothetical protein
MLLDARRLLALLAALALALTAGPAATSASIFDAGPATTVAPDAGASAQTTVDSCTTITESGIYLLTADVENAGDTAISQSCVEIRADDVTFDGGGHALEGRGESHTAGIAVLGADGVEIRHVETRDWHDGVAVENGSATVREVRTHANAYGVRLENADATVSNSTVADNLVGIYALGASEVTLADNDRAGNELWTGGVGNETVTAPGASVRNEALAAP